MCLGNTTPIWLTWFRCSRVSEKKIFSKYRSMAIAGTRTNKIFRKFAKWRLFETFLRNLTYFFVPFDLLKIKNKILLITVWTIATYVKDMCKISARLVEWFSRYYVKYHFEKRSFEKNSFEFWEPVLVKIMSLKFAVFTKKNGRIFFLSWKIGIFLLIMTAFNAKSTPKNLYPANSCGTHPKA